MKRSVLPFLFFCVFLISAGCSSQPKNAVATDYSVKSQAEISVSNDGFPISISNLLDRFKTYDFYETLNLETISAEQIGSLTASDATLYIVDGAPEVHEEKQLDTGYPVYYYDQLTIIYTGSNEAILQALDEQLNVE